jgi:prophage maintenance system killer protein
MDFVYPDVSKEYRRWVNLLVEESRRFLSCTISIIDVLDAHFSIVDFFYDARDEKAVGGVGPRDVGLLSSAVARQTTSFADKYKWNTDYEKCATLFYGLTKNHAFHDCNKRTAMLVALYYLHQLNRTPTVRHKELERLAVRVSDDRLHEYKRYGAFKGVQDGEVYFLADYFSRNTRKIDKRYYIITYHQLNSKLRNFNCRLENPHKNCIDIIKTEKKRKYFGLGREYTKKTKVGTIGFPGWTKEVPRKDINSLRLLAGLTHRDGFDSEVFYRGAEPLKSLINEYSGLLRRLSRK